MIPFLSHAPESRALPATPLVSRHVLTFSLLLVILLLSGCSRSGGRDLPDITTNLVIEPDPPRIGPATILLEVTDASGLPVHDAAISLEGNMNHAGMVPVISQATEIAPGRYKADLEFTMGGDWFIMIRAELIDGRTLERTIDVPGVDVICGETPTP